MCIHCSGDTEATKVMGFWFSFFPHRECDMELLQEELDRMEMSCLQGERCPQGVRSGGCRTQIQSPDMSPSCAWGHVCYPSVPRLCQGMCYHPGVSPSSTWGQEHWEDISTPAMFLQSPRTWSSPERWPGTFLDLQGGCHPAPVARGQHRVHMG